MMIWSTSTAAMMVIFWILPAIPKAYASNPNPQPDPKKLEEERLAPFKHFVYEGNLEKLDQEIECGVLKFRPTQIMKLPFPTAPEASAPAASTDAQKLLKFFKDYKNPVEIDVEKFPACTGLEWNWFTFGQTIIKKERKPDEKAEGVVIEYFTPLAAYGYTQENPGTPLHAHFCAVLLTIVNIGADGMFPGNFTCNFPKLVFPAESR